MNPMFKFGMAAPIIAISAKENMKIVENPKLWLFAAQEYYRGMYPYIPYRDGDLANNVTITSDSTTGYIEHDANYATYVYGQDFNFRKDKHPLASSKWDEAAMPTVKPKVINAITKYLEL